MEEPKNPPTQGTKESAQASLMKNKAFKTGLTIVAILVSLVLINLVFNRLSTRGPAADRNHVTVDITNEGFDPAIVRIQKGTKVTWRNTLDQSYGVLPAGQPDEPQLEFGKEIIAADAIHEYSFDETGTFNYHDPQNPTVKGTIMVVED